MGKSKSVKFLRLEKNTKEKLENMHSDLWGLQDRHHKELQKHGFLTKLNNGRFTLCEQCVMGKSKRVKFSKSKKNT